MKITLSKGTLRFLKYGAPMLIFMLAGSYGLSEFTELRVKKREETVRQLTAEEARKFNNKKKNIDSLDTLYETMKKEVKIDEWENIRGPRIWEEETLKILPTYKPKDQEQ